MGKVRVGLLGLLLGGAIGVMALILGWQSVAFQRQMIAFDSGLDDTSALIIAQQETNCFRQTRELCDDTLARRLLVQNHRWQIVGIIILSVVAACAGGLLAWFSGRYGLTGWREWRQALSAPTNAPPARREH